DVARLGKHRQCRTGAGDAQLRLAPAPDQLLRLSEEFDLADAAATQLDVVSGDGDGRAAPVRVDLALDRMDVLNGGEVEMLAPQEGAERGDEIAARFEVARHGPRADERGAFPILSGALVVDDRRLERQRRRGRARIGPEPQIGAEDITVYRALFHHAHQLMRQAG